MSLPVLSVPAVRSPKDHIAKTALCSGDSIGSSVSCFSDSWSPLCRIGVPSLPHASGRSSAGCLVRRLASPLASILRPTARQRGTTRRCRRLSGASPPRTHPVGPGSSSGWSMTTTLSLWRPPACHPSSAFMGTSLHCFLTSRGKFLFHRPKP